MKEVTTKLFSPGAIEEKLLIYVVIGARHNGKWIFVRHRDRLTWELPAGHIEKEESADQAAVRELYEEAGVIRSRLVHLLDYAVTVDKRTEHGRLYGAAAEALESHLAFEIEEVMFSHHLPEALTYPEVQTILFDHLEQHF